MASYDTQAEQIKRRRALQDAMMQRIMAPKENAGPWSALSDIGSALLLSKGGGRLDEQELALADEKSTAQRNMLANILAQPDQRSMIEAGAASPFDKDLELSASLAKTLYPVKEKEKLKDGEVLLDTDYSVLYENKKDAPERKLTSVDRGDAVDLIDSTGNVVRTLPKGSKPEDIWSEPFDLEVSKGKKIKVRRNNAGKIEPISGGSKTEVNIDRLPSGYQDASAPDKSLKPIKGGPEWQAQAEKLAKAEGNLQETTKAVNDLWKEIDDAGTQVQKYGISRDPKRAAKLKSAYTRLQLRIKEQFGLGAPQLADMQLLEAFIADPTAIVNGVRGADAVKETLKNVYADLEANKQRLGEQYQWLGKPINVPEFAYAEGGKAKGAAPTGTPQRRQARDKKTGEMAEFEQRDGKWVRVK